MRFAAFLSLLCCAFLVSSAGADQPDSAYSCTPATFGNSSTVNVTWYDNSTLGLAACHYSDPTLPGGTSEAQQYYAAAATHLYDDNICGACAQVTDKGNGKSVTVMITDECPASTNATYCSSGSYHLDLSQNAFQQMEALSVGVFNVTWHVVPCPNNFMNVKGQNGANLTYSFKDGANSGWAVLIIRDYIMPIKSVEYCSGSGSGCVAAAWQRSYNGWLPSGTWNSFYLRITDKGGNQANFGPISCCSPILSADTGGSGSAAKKDTSAVYANLPTGQMPGCGSPTRTYTVNPNFTPPTSTITPTLTPTPADCPLLFNSCDSTTANGAWSGSNGTQALNTTVTAAITQGTGSMRFVITTTSSFNNNIALLTGFTPSNWTPYTRLTMDVYVDPNDLVWTSASTYHQMEFRVDCGSGYQIDPTGGQALALASGMNHLTFNLNGWATNSPAAVTKLYLCLNLDVAGLNPGEFFVDNVVLHTDAACPPPSPTSTATPSSSSTFSRTPSPTASATAVPNTPTPSSTPTLSRTPSPTASSTVVPNTATPSSTSSPTRTPSLTATQTLVPSTATPSGTASPTRTPSPTASATAVPNTATPSSTSSPTHTPSATASATAVPNTPTPSSTSSPSRTPSPTASPTATPALGTATSTATLSPVLSRTPTSTPNPFSPTATPSSSSSATRTATPSSSATVLPATLTASPTASPTSSRTSTPVPPTATHTASPVVSATPSGTAVLGSFTSSPTRPPTPVSTATSTATLTPLPATDTRTAVPPSPTAVPGTSTLTSTPVPGSFTQTPTATPTRTRTATPLPPSFTATPTAVPTLGATANPSATPTESPTAVPSATPQPPNVAILSPAPAGTVSGNPVTVLITASGNQGAGIASVRVLDGATVLGNAVSTGGGNYSFTWTNPPSGPVTLTVVATDFNGQASSQGDSFTITASSPTVTPTPGATGPVQVVAVAGIPNPDPQFLAVQLAYGADKLVARLYTTGMRLVGSLSTGPQQAGWVKVPLPAEYSGLAIGTYYVVVGGDAQSRGGSQAIARLVKLK